LKQQLRHADVAFDSLDNWIPARTHPPGVQAFFDRETAWPLAPLTAADRRCPPTRIGSRFSKWEGTPRPVLARPAQHHHFEEAMIR
jgi:hypothetical protein